jgi:hypothetical protein
VWFSPTCDSNANIELQESLMRDVDTSEPAHSVEEAVKKPHRATRFRDGIYPITGGVIAIVVLVGLVFYFT